MNSEDKKEEEKTKKEAKPVPTKKKAGDLVPRKALRGLRLKDVPDLKKSTVYKISGKLPISEFSRLSTFATAASSGLGAIRV